MRNIIILIILIPFLNFSQIQVDDHIDFKKYQPILEVGMGVPWLLEINGGVKINKNKILIGAKGFILFNKLEGSYQYYLNDNFSVGLGLGLIKKNKVFGTEKNLRTISPTISYKLKNENRWRVKEFKIGFDLSRNSEFGFQISENTFLLPSIHFKIPLYFNNVKKKKSSKKILINTSYKEFFEKSIKYDEKKTRKYLKFKNDIIEKDFIVDKKILSKIISNTKKYLGTPYVYGGNNKKGIDCSGLFHICFQYENIIIPRVAEEIARLGKLIYDETQLLKGDFIYFTETGNSNKLITHMGMYLGRGDFIHSSSSNGVTITNLTTSNYWKERFLFGKRIRGIWVKK